MIFPKRAIAPFLLANAAATVYTAPVNSQVIIKKLTFTNTDTVAHSVSLHLIPGGGSASVANLLIDAQVVAPAHTFEAFVAENHDLNGGSLTPSVAPDFIQAFADTASQVNMMLTIVVVTL